ncbi:uncharacterized protein BDZ99DRAFT_468120 [Mytilinidion resinicola]|uniref:Uncharacterized protein n=1 Tax=Mytilinidion resinicola TaxID=574789 RepID=A0A6A6Y4M2_9PEZI|nr:uncharacterized protein BDZ99DRAFT_468120 [Mytilinidion resinicola]KAF2803579.1 hypothetical protein BDZ99DRAFT_468120 [Mytilinidion resinicola]
MAADESAEIVNVINLHASALLELSKTHGTAYQTWLRSLDQEHRSEFKKQWTQLVNALDRRKGTRRRKQVESFLSRRNRIPKTPTHQESSSKVSAWEKREDLFVLCTNITIEELVSLNRLEEPASFFKATEHLLGQYDFAEAYRRSLGRETRRVRDRILERFECLVFYLNIVLGGFHSGTGWLHGGHNRLLEVQNPPDDLVKAKKRNERMAERGLSYYCWGVFLGDLRNLIRLRADEDVPESLYGDRHHRPRIPYYANQLFEAGLCEDATLVQTCADSIIQTWPVIPKTVTLQVATALMQGKHWDLLSSEAKRKTEERISLIMEAFFPNLTINSSHSSTGMPPDRAGDTSPAESPSERGPIGISSQPLEEERPSADSIGDKSHMQSDPSVLESEMAWYPAPDLMYGTMFTSFVEPIYDSAFSNGGWPDSTAGRYSADGTV